MSNVDKSTYTLMAELYAVLSKEDADKLRLLLRKVREEARCGETPKPLSPQDHYLREAMRADIADKLQRYDEVMG